MTDHVAGWPVKRLRFLLRQMATPEQHKALSEAEQVNFVPMEAVGDDGGMDLSALRDREAVEKGYTLFFDGDVVVAKITPCFENGKGALACGLCGGVAYGTTELHVLSPGPDLDGRFLYYVTVSDAFRIQGEAAMKGAAGQKRVPAEFIQDFRLAVPPLDEQRRIVSWLDEETAHLDALVAEKERMLALLAERRTALVAQAVTRGLDPGITLCPSGLDWLGDIPAHWTTARAKTLLRLREDLSTAGDEELLTVSHLTGVTPRSEKDVNMFKAESLVGYKRCQPGDLVVNTLWGWMGAMGVTAHTGIVSPAYHVYEPVGALSPLFLDVLCRSKPFVAEVTSRSKGVWSSRLRIYPEAFLDIQMPVPPADEQRMITNALADYAAQDAALEDAVRATLALLIERRRALVSSAVTGRVSVPDLAPA